jgi:REP element-mobilizing transposase RayT
MYSSYFFVWCGSRAKDKFTGQSYEHRHGWVAERLLFLSSVFSIGICAYAVMSNHTHVMWYVDKDLVESWSMEDVIKRWYQFTKARY